ncbi:MAG: response regulator [Gemmatimonadaceae bacterium]|nr:response regulator [Gemmatimonadaceae bacterium]
MFSTSAPAEASAKPPIIVVGVEQEWAARSLESVLGPRGFAVVRAYSGRQTLDLAEVAAPDVVLIDSRLPDMDGVDVCRALRQERRVGAHVPVVLTTSGPAPREFVRNAYLAGAWSVWEQPLDGELLVLRLLTWVDAKRVVDEAERVSLVDVDSGLYTYSGLHRRAREVMSDAARRHTPVSCIAVAPVMLRSATGTEEIPVPVRVANDIARMVAGTARGSDVVGRMGSAEFAIVAPMTELTGAVEMVERLRDRIATLPPVLADGRAARVALRAGLVTIADPGIELRDSSDLLVRASTALRYAQSSRAPGVRTFDEVPATFV